MPPTDFRAIWKFGALGHAAHISGGLGQRGHVPCQAIWRFEKHFTPKRKKHYLQHILVYTSHLIWLTYEDRSHVCHRLHAIPGLKIDMMWLEIISEWWGFKSWGIRSTGSDCRCHVKVIIPFYFFTPQICFLEIWNLLKDGSFVVVIFSTNQRFLGGNSVQSPAYRFKPVRWFWKGGVPTSHWSTIGSIRKKGSSST